MYNEFPSQVVSAFRNDRWKGFSFRKKKELYDIAYPFSLPSYVPPQSMLIFWSLKDLS